MMEEDTTCPISRYQCDAGYPGWWCCHRSMTWPWCLPWSLNVPWWGGRSLSSRRFVGSEWPETLAGSTLISRHLKTILWDSYRWVSNPDVGFWRTLFLRSLSQMDWAVATIGRKTLKSELKQIFFGLLPTSITLTCVCLSDTCSK